MTEQQQPTVNQLRARARNYLARTGYFHPNPALPVVWIPCPDCRTHVTARMNLGRYGARQAAAVLNPALVDHWRSGECSA